MEPNDKQLEGSTMYITRWRAPELQHGVRADFCAAS
jgi:hypothetical protein